MLYDTLCTFSENQDVSSGSQASTNSFDAGIRSNYDDALNPHQGAANISNGLPVRCQVTLNNIIVASGSPTVQVAVQQAPDNSTWGNLVESEVFTPTTGQDIQFDMFVPQGQIDEYLQAYFTIAGTGSFTSISASASLYAGGLQTSRVW